MGATSVYSVRRISASLDRRVSTTASSVQERTWAKLETRPFTDETTSVTGKASAPAASPAPTPPPNLQAQREKIARAGFNFLNIPLHPPEQASASPVEQKGIQRQEEEKQDLQMKPLADSIQRREIQEEEQKEETEPAVQLKCSECQQEEQEKKSESVQTKLSVGKPGDKYEQEADQMAAKVMAMPDTAIQQPTEGQTEEKQEKVQM